MIDDEALCTEYFKFSHDELVKIKRNTDMIKSNTQFETNFLTFPERVIREYNAANPPREATHNTFGHEKGTTAFMKPLWVDGKKCQVCSKEESGEVKLFKCSRCKSVLYCGRDHQKQHYPQHKKHCKSIAEGL
jgi:hypothetical protein